MKQKVVSRVSTSAQTKEKKDSYDYTNVMERPIFSNVCMVIQLDVIVTGLYFE